LVPEVASEDDTIYLVDTEEAYRQAVLDYVPPSKDDLLLELEEPDPAARVAAVSKVGSLQPREAIEVISHVFSNEEDMTVHSRAVAALSRLDAPGARGLLRDLALGDDDAGLRMQALNALASSRGERAINVVNQALRRDPEPGVRMSAIRALGRVGGNWARRALERAARDVDPAISLAAEEALAAWPQED
jgi:HEAT repeat protein